MDAAFLDTAYVYALLNSRDHWHARAKQWEQFLARQRRPLITTEYVLVEIADGLANLRFRAQAAQTLDALRSSSFVEIVPGSSELLSDALNLYRRRSDKEWGLTDCASFVVMEQRTLHDALTTDEHFTQAGFQALMLNNPE